MLVAVRGMIRARVDPVGRVARPDDMPETLRRLGDSGYHHPDEDRDEDTCSKTLHGRESTAVIAAGPSESKGGPGDRLHGSSPFPTRRRGPLLLGRV